MAAALLALLLLGAAVGYVLTRDDGDGGEVTTGTTASTTTTAPETSPPSTEEETTTSTTTTSTTTTSTTTTTTTTTTAPEPEITAEDLEAVAGDYYALVGGGDIEASYALLSPAFQERQDFASYQQWWTEDVESVSIESGPRGSAGSLTADLTLRYEMASGDVSVEDVLLTFVEAEDGTLLIDTYDVIASRRGGDGDGDD